MGEKTIDGGETPEKKLYFPLVSPERAKDYLPPLRGYISWCYPCRVGGFTPACVLGVPSGLSFAQAELLNLTAKDDVLNLRQTTKSYKKTLSFSHDLFLTRSVSTMRPI